MKRSQKLLYLVGASVSIAGSLAPWWYLQGDFSRTDIYGVRIYTGLLPVWNPGNSTVPLGEDNGGLLIILLTACVIGLAFRAPRFVRRPRAWIMAGTISIIALVVYHIIRLSLQYGSWGANAFGFASGLDLGLRVALLGAVVMLLAGLWEYRTRNPVIGHHEVNVRA